MDTKEVLKRVMKEAGMTQANVAEKAGLPGQGSISMFLRSKSMRVDSMLMLLGACGYTLVARSKDGTGPEYIVGDETGVQVTKCDPCEYDKQYESAEDELRAAVRGIIREEVQQFYSAHADGPQVGIPVVVRQDGGLDM